eukprot:maker-scaffold_108-snap-gene-0.9-mRNA-1 protein AED:0.01 eAED:0.01 QI:57/1/1/1/1/1/3/18/619
MSNSLPLTPALKIILNNVGKNASKKTLTKLLTTNGLPSESYKSLKKPPREDFAVISFHSKEELEKAKTILPTLKNEVNQKQFIVNDHDPTLKSRKPIPETKVTCIEDAVAPLREVPYEEQIRKKQRDIVKVLKKFKKESVKFETKLCGKKLDNLPFWYQKDYLTKTKEEKQKFQEAKRQKLDTLDNYNTGKISQCACPVEKIVESPILKGYRNKCEFTFGVDEKNKLVLGFRSGGFHNSKIFSATLDCLIVSEEMILVTKKVQEILKDQKVYDPKTRKGVLRQLTIRQSDTDLLLLFQINTSNLINIENPTKKQVQDNDEFKQLAEKIKSELFEKEFKYLKVSSVGFTFYNGHSVQENATFDLFFGNKYLMQTLNGQKFIVSPGAFFQTNKFGAEKLYKKISEKIEKHSEKNKLLILDVCCGTGTIGLNMKKLLEKEVVKVLGIDFNQSSIEDARENAKLNHMEDDAFFVSAKVEDVLGDLCVKPGQKYNKTAKMEENKRFIENLPTIEKENLERMKKILKESIEDEEIEVVAIVDPARPGLQKSVLRILRLSSFIRTLIYVSCNPKGSFIENAKDLCASTNTKNRLGKPFYPVEAIPVDMFPHTEHIELITVFKELKN